MHVHVSVNVLCFVKRALGVVDNDLWPQELLLVMGSVCWIR